MRKLMITAALATAALAAAVGCTTATPQTTPTSLPTTIAASDDTVAVCGAAQSYATQAATSVLIKVAEGQQAQAAGDAAKAQAALTDGKKLLTDWAAEFKQLSAKEIKPAVKAAVDGIAGFAESTATSTSPDAGALQATYAGLSAALAAACA